MSLINAPSMYTKTSCRAYYDGQRREDHSFARRRSHASKRWLRCSHRRRRQSVRRLWGPRQSMCGGSKHRAPPPSYHSEVGRKDGGARFFLPRVGWLGAWVCMPRRGCRRAAISEAATNPSTRGKGQKKRRPEVPPSRQTSASGYIRQGRVGPIYRRPCRYGRDVSAASILPSGAKRSKLRWQPRQQPMVIWMGGLLRGTGMVLARNWDGIGEE